MNKALADKLKIKEVHSLLVLNSPEGFLTKSFRGDHKPGSGNQYDFVLLFIKSKEALDTFAAKVINTVKPTSLLWIAYPKKTSGIKTDMNRDYGWDAITGAGFEAVAQVAIDDTWSALRFRKRSKTSKREAGEKERKSFTAILEKPDDGMDTAFISIPFNVEEVYGTKGQVKVKASFDGYPYRGILANMGMGCHVIIVRKDIRQAIGKGIGDRVSVELEQDQEERTVEIPHDLKKALSESPKVLEFFNTLSFTNRKEYSVWITSAKKTETRDKRLALTISKLLKGKRNPSEK
jgi:hypothetical protein